MTSAKKLTDAERKAYENQLKAYGDVIKAADRAYERARELALPLLPLAENFGISEYRLAEIIGRNRHSVRSWKTEAKQKHPDVTLDEWRETHADAIKGEAKDTRTPMLEELEHARFVAERYVAEQTGRKP